MTDTRSALLDAAADLFARKGYKATSVGEITARVGVNRALVSYHFGGKAELYQALLDDAIDAAKLALDGAAVDVKASDPEVQLVRALAGIYQARPHLAAMLVREHLDPDYLVSEDGAQRLPGFSVLTNRLLNAIEQEGRARHDPQIVHLIVVGALIYFLISAPFRAEVHADKAPTLDSFSKTLGQVLAKGLRG